MPAEITRSCHGHLASVPAVAVSEAEVAVVVAVVVAVKLDLKKSCVGAHTDADCVVAGSGSTPESGEAPAAGGAAEGGGAAEVGGDQ